MSFLLQNNQNRQQNNLVNMGNKLSVIWYIASADLLAKTSTTGLGVLLYKGSKYKCHSYFLLLTSHFMF